MAFRFRLEKVLKYRQRLVDQQARELAAAGRKVSQITERIRDLRAEILSFESSFPPTQLQFSIQERMNMVRWIEHLRENLSRWENDLAEAQTEMKAQQEKMTLAWQDLEVLKKLSWDSAGGQDAERKACLRLGTCFRIRSVQARDRNPKASGNWFVFKGMAEDSTIRWNLSVWHPGCVGLSAVRKFGRF